MKNKIHRLPIGIRNIEIPTGYSDGLSYLEQLGAINHKLNEVIDKVNAIDSDTSDNVIINNYITDTLVEVAQISPMGRYEQNYNSVGWAQGMCVININSQDMIVYATASDSASHQSVGIISNLLNGGSGNLYREKQYNNLGHCNSITTDGEYIYIACGGGKVVVSQVVKLDLNLEIVDTYIYPEYINPYGIAFNKGKFYIIGSDETLYITDDLHRLGNPIKLNKRNNTTVQGIVADDNYIFLPNGNWWTNYPSTSGGQYGHEHCVNYVDVYDHKGKFIKSIVINCPSELEEFDFTSNGDIVIMSNSINSCVFLKSELYSSLTNFESQNNLITVPQAFTDKSYNVYIGNAMGIRQDGTEEYPFNSFNMMYYGIPNNVTNLNINLKNSIEQRLTPRGLVFGTLYIYGNGNTIQGGMRINNQSVICNNVIFEAKNRSDEVVRTDNSIVEFKNCTFKQNTSNSYCVRINNTEAVFNNTIFSRSAGASTTENWANIIAYNSPCLFTGTLTDGGIGRYAIDVPMRYYCSNSSNFDNNIMQCVNDIGYSNMMSNVYNVGNMDLNNIVSIYNTPINVMQCTNKPDTRVSTVYLIRYASTGILEYAYSDTKIWVRRGICEVGSKNVTWGNWGEI